MIVLPAGAYYIGDPCYAQVSHDDYEQFVECSGGIVLLSGGRLAAAFGTAYGDGEYRGSDGFDYGVDSGLLSAIPMELVTSTDGGTVVTFDTEFSCGADRDGWITFGSIRIDTGQSDDGDET